MSEPTTSEVRRVRTGAGLTVVLERFGGTSERPPVLLLHGGGGRALGRMVRAGTGPADPAFTASYRLVAGDDGRVHRLAVTSATAGREPHIHPRLELVEQRLGDALAVEDAGGRSIVGHRRGSGMAAHYRRCAQPAQNAA